MLPSGLRVKIRAKGSEKMKLRNNTGCLFENRNKRSKRDPDFTGTVVIDSRRYRARGWSKATRKGGWFLDMKMEPKK